MAGSLRNDWEPCPPGEFARLAARLGRRRRRRVFLGGVSATSLAVLLFATWFVLRGEREYTFGGISCSRVMQLAEAYGAGQLDETLRDQVRRHVQECPHCGPLYKKMGLAVRTRPGVWTANGSAEKVEALKAVYVGISFGQSGGPEEARGRPLLKPSA